MDRKMVKSLAMAAATALFFVSAIGLASTRYPPPEIIYFTFPSCKTNINLCNTPEEKAEAQARIAENERKAAIARRERERVEAKTREEVKRLGAHREAEARKLVEMRERAAKMTAAAAEKPKPPPRQCEKYTITSKVVSQPEGASLLFGGFKTQDEAASALTSNANAFCREFTKSTGHQLQGKACTSGGGRWSCTATAHCAVQGERKCPGSGSQ